MTDDEFDLAERERIRQALFAYMKEHKIGVPTLAARIKDFHPRKMEIPLKTLQRFLAGMRTQDMAVGICKAFVEKLPNRPTAMHALGEALYTVYGKPPDISAGEYAISTDGTIISELVLTQAPQQQFLLVKEVAKHAHRIYDGVLVFAGSNILAMLKDRLMLTARVHAMYRASDDFHGIVCDDIGLASGGTFRILTTIIRPAA